MIRTLTDSTGDLSKEVLASLGIETIPMLIQVDGKVFQILRILILMPCLTGSGKAVQSLKEYLLS